MFRGDDKTNHPDDNQKKLANIIERELKHHSRHPSLRTGLRGIFISRIIPLVRRAVARVRGLNRLPLW